MISSVLRASCGQILEGTQADTKEGVGGWLAPPSWSGGLCAEEREREEEEEEEGSPPSSSSDTSDIAGSLELKERKNI